MQLGRHIQLYHQFFPLKILPRQNLASEKKEVHDDLPHVLGHDDPRTKKGMKIKSFGDNIENYCLFLKNLGKEISCSNPSYTGS